MDMNNALQQKRNGGGGAVVGSLNNLLSGGNAMSTSGGNGNTGTSQGVDGKAGDAASSLSQVTSHTAGAFSHLGGVINQQQQQQQQELGKESYTRFKDGYPLIKASLQEAARRVQAVRIGTPFEQILLEESARRAPQSSKSSGGGDRGGAGIMPRGGTFASLDSGSAGTNFSARAYRNQQQQQQQPPRMTSSSVREVVPSSASAAGAAGSAGGWSSPSASSPLASPMAHLTVAVQFDQPGWSERLASVQNLEQKRTQLSQNMTTMMMTTMTKRYLRDKNLNAHVHPNHLSLFDLDPERKAYFTAMYDRNILGKDVALPQDRKSLIGGGGGNGDVAMMKASGFSARSSGSAVATGTSASAPGSTAVAPGKSVASVDGTIITTTLTRGDGNPSVHVDAGHLSPSAYYEKSVRERNAEFYRTRNLAVLSLTDNIQKMERERQGAFRRKWEALNIVLAHDTNNTLTNTNTPTTTSGLSPKERGRPRIGAGAPHGKKRQSGNPTRELQRMRNQAFEMKVAERMSGYQDILSSAANATAANGRMSMLAVDGSTAATGVDNQSAPPPQPIAIKQYEKQLMKKIKTYV